MIYAAKQIPIKSFVYSVNKIPKGYMVIKWDGLLNVERIYYVYGTVGKRMSCDCPNRHWHNNPCKHRTIVTTFDLLGRINRGWFYDLELDRWYLPLPSVALGRS